MCVLHSDFIAVQDQRHRIALSSPCVASHGKCQTSKIIYGIFISIHHNETMIAKDILMVLMGYKSFRIITQVTAVDAIIF